VYIWTLPQALAEREHQLHETVLATRLGAQTVLVAIPLRDLLRQLARLPLY
jgi:hypothetical protein